MILAHRAPEMKNKKPTLLHFSALAFTLLLAGCGSKNNSSDQVAARVNGVEITTAQMEPGLREAANSDNSDQVKRDFLNRLIDRELAVQKAMELKLDRYPTVMLELEEMRRNILARAYARELAQRPENKVAPKQAEAYFNAHPELYAQRKVYMLRILSWNSEMPEWTALNEQINDGKTVAEVTNWLNEKKAAYRGQVSTLPAEQLAPDVAVRLVNFKDNEGVFVRGDKEILAYQILSASPAPRSFADTQTDILNQLTREKLRAALDKKMKELRTYGQVEYLGDYAVATAIETSKQ
jgi:EpsD family peptidyl-prolyl cis-trans isomerase